jgi:hypothetical protein
VGPNYRDGCFGLRLFAESRGYVVNDNFTQLIRGQGGDPNQGFTFDDFMAEINAGRPVLIQVSGHTMLGFGYESTAHTVYLHDTWDFLDHSMIWGASYSGMAQWGVTVLQVQGGSTIHVGDVNCDGTYGYQSFGDINPFVLYLSNFSSWQATYPGCDARNGDINQDGTYGYQSFGDINPFVALLSTP